MGNCPRCKSKSTTVVEGHSDLRRCGECGELFPQASRMVVEEEMVTCPYCHGRGGTLSTRCGFCEGNGKVPASEAKELEDWFDEVYSQQVDEGGECPACAGRGKKGNAPCGVCHGEGCLDADAHQRAIEDLGDLEPDDDGLAEDMDGPIPGAVAPAAGFAPQQGKEVFEDDDDEDDDGMGEYTTCPTCGGECFELGRLGRMAYYRCRQCGMDVSSLEEDYHGDQMGRLKPTKYFVNFQVIDNQGGRTKFLTLCPRAVTALEDGFTGEEPEADYYGSEIDSLSPPNEYGWAVVLHDGDGNKTNWMTVNAQLIDWMRRILPTHGRVPEGRPGPLSQGALGESARMHSSLRRPNRSIVCPKCKGALADRHGCRTCSGKGWLKKSTKPGKLYEELDPDDFEQPDADDLAPDIDDIDDRAERMAPDEKALVPFYKRIRGISEDRGQKYVVVDTIPLGYDSDVRAPTPRRFKRHQAGAVLTHDGDAPNGNVWFIDGDGDRGKIESGSINNLVKRGVIRLAEGRVWNKASTPYYDTENGAVYCKRHAPANATLEHFGEADYPVHCETCHELLDVDLTSDGDDFVKAAFREFMWGKGKHKGDEDTIEAWKEKWPHLWNEVNQDAEDRANDEDNHQGRLFDEAIDGADSFGQQWDIAQARINAAPKCQNCGIPLLGRNPAPICTKCSTGVDPHERERVDEVRASRPRNAGANHHSIALAMAMASGDESKIAAAKAAIHAKFSPEVAKRKIQNAVRRLEHVRKPVKEAGAGAIDDNEFVELCRDCYDEAGWENEHSDRAHDLAGHASPDCPICQKLGVTQGENGRWSIKNAGPVEEATSVPEGKISPTPRQIADKHGVSIERVMTELEKGTKIEFEHTTDENVAREIALDHLWEDGGIDYYTRLAKMEKEGKPVNESCPLTPDVDAWLKEFKDYAEANADPYSSYGKIGWDVGGRFIRVWSSPGGQRGRASIFFLDGDGNIYKTASWRAPAKGVRATISSISGSEAAKKHLASYGGWLYQRG
jgi:hypothetical protein